MSSYAMMGTNGVRLTYVEIAGIDRAAKATCPKVTGVSAVLYTTPQIVMLHCDNDDLSVEEQSAVESSLIEFGVKPIPRDP